MGGCAVKGPVATHRETCLRQARVYLQQARAHRLRWMKRNGGEAMSMFEGGWFFDLLEFAAGRRESVRGIPGRWWRMPSGLVFRLDGGFNQVMCVDIPAFRAKGWEARRGGCWYGVHGVTVHRDKYRAFLDRCESLGDDEPMDLIRAQVRRLEKAGRWQPHQMLRGDSYGDEIELQATACQMELFA